MLGAGTIGLLATAALRARGLEVSTIARSPRPNLNSELVEALGPTYVSIESQTISQVAEHYGQFDLIFEATGFSPIVFEAMCVLLAKNGIIVLSSVTGGMRRVEVASDAINLDFVLGNKVMVGTVNANRVHFEAGVRDLAVLEASYVGRPLMSAVLAGIVGHGEAAEVMGLTGPLGLRPRLI